MATEFDVYQYERSALYDPALNWVEEKMSDQELNLYHTIDRKLFYMLICNLGRNVDESMHVVAFLIWLEKIRYSRNVVFKVISWPLHLVLQLADEVAALLICLMSTHLDESISMYLLSKLCSGEINLPQFHRNRIKILENVKKVVVEVCMRAFGDILTGGNPVFVPPPVYPHFAGGFPQLGFGENLGPVNYLPPTQQLANILEDPNADLSEFCGGLQLVDGCEDELDVPPDDRTIFLTFSRGYYIAKVEIQVFFTRIFGQFIEEIYMEDAPSDQQPLFARMVCRSPSIIPKIAPPGEKSVYSINGKRIYAKKFERSKKSGKKKKKGGGSTSQSATN
ncbi:hypothetical protein POM88_020263 [Heracleum sosnowskyi]|uniref:Uncharacterized protein n=1 Tax=Heracleum sosnowskyi TaxID=360622 RepID=A0AAD8IDS0_9APIA|nr:hypothetical protein POM88_020263 [Heracleum sosnowskyi]